MKQTREETMRIPAEKYSYFLNTLKFDDDIYMVGMGEARTKFLANLHITIMKKSCKKNIMIGVLVPIM